MPSVHRELNFRRFVAAAPPDLLQRYFDGLTAGSALAGWAALNGDELERFLSLPENSELNAIIRKDMQRINDLCGRGQSLRNVPVAGGGGRLVPERRALRLGPRLSHRNLPETERERRGVREGLVHLASQVRNGQVRRAAPGRRSVHGRDGHAG